MGPRETPLTGLTSMNLGSRALSVQMCREPRTRLDLQEVYWVGGGGLVWMPGKSQRRVLLIRARTWGPRGQQAAWECQLQAAGINFLYAGRAVPVAMGARLSPGRQHPVLSDRLRLCLAPSRNGPDTRATLPHLFIQCPSAGPWIA